MLFECRNLRISAFNEENLFLQGPTENHMYVKWAPCWKIFIIIMIVIIEKERESCEESWCLTRPTWSMQLPWKRQKS